MPGGLDNDCGRFITVIITGLCAIGLLLTVILVPSSLRRVNFDEYAVRYTKINRKVDTSKVYTEGRYVFEPSAQLFTFPKVVNKLAMPIRCLTRDGILMDLDVDIQYQIPDSEIFTIFYTFGDPETFQTVMRLVSSDSIRDTCGDYDAQNFYQNRSIIQQTMQSNIVSGFTAADIEIILYVIILRDYDFPSSLGSAITRKRVAENDIVIATNERQGAITDAETTLLIATQSALRLGIQAEASVTAVLNEAYEAASAITEVWIQRAKYFETIKNNLNMTADDFVNIYLSNLILQTTDNPITDMK